jgi:peptidyl-prolyl cis-trans isomerase C
MRTIRLTAAAVALAALTGVAGAQTTDAPAPAAPPAATATPAARPDPVVARVNGAEIHLSDVQEAIAGLPEEYRSMPPQMLFPMLLDQLIARRWCCWRARRDCRTTRR